MNPWEREIARYLETDEGKATTALNAAAAKAGFDDELCRVEMEILVSTDPDGFYGPPGGKYAFVVWNKELSEDPGFVYPREAKKRAVAWLRVYAARKGWTVRES